MIEFIGILSGEENIIEVMMLIKVTGENVKFMGNLKVYSRELCERELTCLILNRFTFHNGDNISLRLLPSFNTLNSKLKFKQP